MEIEKTYIADTLSEAMNKARSEFGSDCKLISKRVFKVGGILGIGGTQRVEIRIAIDVVPVSNQVQQKPSRKIQSPQVQRPSELPDYQEIDPRQIYASGGETFPASPVARQQRFYSENQQPVQPQPVMPAPSKDETSDRLLQLMAAMQAQLNSLSVQMTQKTVEKPQQIQLVNTARPSIYPGKLQRAFELLQRSELSENIINKIMPELQMIPETSKEDWDIIKEHLRAKMAGIIKISGPISTDNIADNVSHGAEKLPKLFAFIGTTGVGKTTTLAKIAANLVLKSKKKVVFLTIDTYRIAATQQLGVLGDIIGIPTEVVYKESDLMPCIQTHRDADIILIDTAGRSQRNNLELLDLNKYLYPDKDVNIERLLVISSTTKYRDMLDITKNFGSKVNFDRLIFTKTDESTTWGPMFSLAAETGKPITYLSNGQNIPDDIMPAETNFIIKKIIEYEEA
ncbi:MAG TPA: flagellar biosynthesis protein FlhF [Candidatus Wallbacteria bacterium]|nr:flagellar biosynthesis protein FlhF [Candidatus Wallbacteria bacterium]